MTQISGYDAFKLRQRISFDSTPFELKGYFLLPMAFSHCVFDFKRIGVKINLNKVLKEWVQPCDDGGDKLCVGSTSTGVDKSATMLAEPSGAADITKEDDSEVCKTSCEEFRKALERLNNTLAQENIDALKSIKKKGDAKKLSQEEILVAVGFHLIQKLSGEATTSVKRSNTICPCGCKEKLEGNNFMYIGSEKTLHGELDLISLSQGVGVTATVRIDTEDEEAKESDEEEEVQPDEEMGRRKVNFVFGIDDNKAHRQIIAQAITFAFTEFNIHKDQSPFIPSVFIDYQQFSVFIYNPVDDTLMITNTLFFINDDKAIIPAEKYSGIFFLWIILHHRMFFKKMLQSVDVDKYKSGFKEQVRLSDYEKLCRYSHRVHYNPSVLKLRPDICFDAQVSPEKDVAEKAVKFGKRKRLDTD